MEENKKIYSAPVFEKLGDIKLATLGGLTGKNDKADNQTAKPIS